MSKGIEKEKRGFLLEKEVTLISAVNNSKLGPYLDIFRHYPENIMLEPLGILSGFFKISSHSEESSYIVNFLSSILKKEYYINPKRAIENGFDSALQKVNLALSEIAKEGNTDWLGKIDGVVCVLEKNNLHFSVCGSARILLFRNGTFSEISKDVAADEAAPNPLKTFVNVSSGRLEENDKVIICAPDVFEVFSETEIRKGALRLSPEKFAQFLKTGLVNKLEIVGTIVIDVFRKKETAKKEIFESQPEISNVFSRKAFEKKKPTIKGLPEILKRVENEGEYTDEKTGHIYIHEETEGGGKENAANLFWLEIKEKLADIFYSSKNKTKRKLLLFERSAASVKSDLASKIRAGLEKRRQKKLLEANSAMGKGEASEQEKSSFLSNYSANVREQLKKIKFYRNYPRSAQYLVKTSFNNVAAFFNKITQKRIASTSEPIDISPIKKRCLDFLRNINFQGKNISAISSAQLPSSPPLQLKNKGVSPEFKNNGIENYLEKVKGFPRNIIPDFREIKNIFISFSPKKRLAAAAVLLLIFSVPLIFIKIKDARTVNVTPEPPREKTPSTGEIFSREKNIAFVDTLEKVFKAQDAQKLAILNGKLFIFGKNTIFAQEPGQNTKEISFPKNFGVITEAAPMKDLNLLLIATDQGKMISFIPVSSKFTENNIQLPENSKIAGMGTYLTYLYLLDSQNNQIYRYPRAEGGFGAKADWLKDTLDLSKSECMAIDENIYVPSGDKILKLFKGQKQDFNLEATVNPFVPKEIFANDEIANLYVLDSQNGRVIKYSKDGNLLKQYFNESIKNAADLAVDEKNSKVYLLNADGVSSFDLN